MKCHIKDMIYRSLFSLLPEKRMVFPTYGKNCSRLFFAKGAGTFKATEPWSSLEPYHTIRFVLKKNFGIYNVLWGLYSLLAILVCIVNQTTF